MNGCEWCEVDWWLGLLMVCKVCDKVSVMHGFLVVWGVHEARKSVMMVPWVKAGNQCSVDGEGPLSTFHSSPRGVVAKVMSMTKDLLKG